jgi:hypothetical protein
MKTILLTSLFCLLLFTACPAQSRTNRLQRPCPGTSTPAVVEVQSDGDINLQPCPSKSLLINDAPLSSVISFAGGSRTNFVPYYSAQNTLSKSPLSWNGTLYRFDNPAGSATFRFDLTPDSAGNGAFRLGNTANALDYFRLDQGNNVAQLAARNVTIGDMNNSANGNAIVLDDSAGTLTYQNAARTILEASATDATVKLGDSSSGAVVRVDSSNNTVAIGDVNGNIPNSVQLTVDSPSALITAGGANAVLRIDRGDGTGGLGDLNSIGNHTKLVFDDNGQTILGVGAIIQLGDIDRRGNRTRIDLDDPNSSISLSTGDLAVSHDITPAGLTGTVTIDKPAGTVNIAGGASSNVVTNVHVTANSIVFATARTNDATCSVKNVVAGAGLFTVNMTAACTAETSVGFLVIN